MPRRPLHPASPNASTPEDPRWGRRINATGPISDDTVAYRVGTSPHNPVSVDIVVAAHSRRARLGWTVSRIGGTWITPAAALRFRR